MTEKTIREVTCDECGNLFVDGIAEVDAGAYGTHFHKFCFVNMNAIEVVKALELDDIYIADEYRVNASNKLVHQPAWNWGRSV